MLLLRASACCSVASKLPPAARLRGSGRLAPFCAAARPSRLLESRSRVIPSTSPSPLSSPLSSTPTSSSSSAVSAASALAVFAASMTKSVLVPVADGTEEMEAVIVVDVLRRAGADVVVASVEEEGARGRKEVVCSRGIRLVADSTISSCADSRFDAIVLPGGMPGAERLRDSKALSSILERHRRLPSEGDGVVLAAICAAPQVVFDQAPNEEILRGKKATAHPAFSSKLRDASAAESRVVVDGDVVTSRGPGTAFEFALALVAKLYGQEKADEVAGPMVMGKTEPPLVV